MPARFRFPFWWGVCVFLAIAVFFLWEEHSAHILGALPYLLLLICPLMHYFMHGGHDGHDSNHKGPSGPTTGAGGQP